LRSREFYFIVPSLGILNAGWLLGLIVWIRKRAQPAQHSEEMPEGLKPLLFVGITGVLLNVLLTWDFHVVHHNSYLSMLALLGGLAILVSGAPGRWRVLLAGIQFVYFLVIWVASPLATANRINVGLLIGCLTIVASFWYLSGLVSSEASARFDGASLAGRAKPVSERHLKTAQRRTRSRH
jgi:Co/Zn/Cd efflux system component